MIRFYNCRILSFGGGMKLSSGEVWTDGNIIVHVGPAKAERPEFEREIDLKGNLIMPGFKNAHTHTAMVFFRSLADDMPLQDWLTKQVWPYESKLEGEAIYDLTKLGILEYLSSGVTASFDMYFKNDCYAKANMDAGFRTVICSALNNFDADITNIEREYLKFNSLSELVSYRLGIHGEYTTSMDRIEYMASLAEKYKAPCYTHMSETKSEVEGCIERYGLTPTELLVKAGFYRYGGGAFHCVWVNDRDIELMAENNIWAVSCPASNLKLASGIAPIDKMAEAGVKLALGTDGAGSNNALDMFREMYLVSALQKYLNNDAAAGCADRTMEMACVGGARAMGLYDCDDLAVGKKADLVVIDLNRPNMQPENNIVRNIVYSGSKENVYLTMVNGRILYEDGEFFIGESPEEIYSKANMWVKRIVG
ncbi:MAG: amidohydrolase family protein [Candidatus Limivicinus sp.]|jgi:5-methylthioadenosine/S-adenosylhomocysteine deaminase